MGTPAVDFKTGVTEDARERREKTAARADWTRAPDSLAIFALSSVDMTVARYSLAVGALSVVNHRVDAWGLGPT